MFQVIAVVAGRQTRLSAILSTNGRVSGVLVSNPRGSRPECSVSGLLASIRVCVWLSGSATLVS